MLKRFRAILTLLLVFGLSAALRSDESKITQYLPDTLGSYWVYIDQDGNELTRRVVEGEEVAEEIYHGFEYEPALKSSVDYNYHIHANLYQVNEEGVRFLVGDKARRAVQARLAKEIAIFLKIMLGSEPPEDVTGFNLLYVIEVEAQDGFYMLPTSGTSNKKWDAMQIKAKITITPDPPYDGPEEFIFEFTILEKGKVLGTENVETPAGTFGDCLKIEYRTETGLVISDQGEPDGANPPGESVTTLWLAPNVGIVKFHQEAEDIFLKTIPEPEITSSTTVKNFELKGYEIKPANSEPDGSD